ncbi:MAG: AAA family ATPase [Acidobacteriota bacterium]|nr:AAA family ATPase [Acidobacteriota bacterium]
MFEINKDFFENLPRKQKTLLIGIDGCGGAGKSTLAEKIKNTFENITIVQMDDFYFKDHFDWQRLQKQVLEPLRKNLAAEYQRSDWQTETLAEWHKIKIGGIVIVEGVYSIRSELADFYDYKIWVETPLEILLKRGIERDGEMMREKWENVWMPAEDYYVENDFPQKRADLIVNGYN